MTDRPRLLQPGALPDYQRPFVQADYRGCLRLEDCSRTGRGKLFHACHRAEFERILRVGALPLRSRWELKHPEAGEWSGACAWCGLNYYQGNNGNRYGPILLEFPLDVLEGCRLLVFRRIADRTRYFFVQYREGVPLFKRDGKVWRRLKPSAYFDLEEDRWGLKEGAIYDVIVTKRIPLDERVRIWAVHHSKCIPTRDACGSIPSHKTREVVLEVARRPWVRRKYGKMLEAIIPEMDEDDE